MTYLNVLSFIAAATLAYARDFNLSGDVNYPDLPVNYEGWTVTIATDYVDGSAFVHIVTSDEYRSEIGIGSLEWTVAPIALDECYYDVTGDHWPF